MWINASDASCFHVPCGVCVCVCVQHTRIYWRDFRSSLVVKTPWFHCRGAQGPDLIPGQGTKITCTMAKNKQKKNILDPGRGPCSQGCIVIFLLSPSLVHPWKKKNGPYEGKVLVAKRRFAKTSVKAQWPLWEGSVCPHHVAGVLC